MLKLANQVLDIYDDVEMKTLRKLASLNSKINVEEKENVDQYALSIITKKAAKLDKFPINSHDSTWLSNHYFQENFSKLPKLAQEIAAHNIKVACAFYRVEPTPAVEKLAKVHYTNTFYENDEFPQRQLETSDLSKFAEIEQICNNDTFAKYAFGTCDDVKLGAEYFEKFAEKIPVEYRHKYACALQRRAGDLGINLSGLIEKYAGNAYNAHLDAHLSSRKSLLDGKMVVVMDKLAEMKNDMPPIEFARLLHQFDKKANLEKYYGSFLTNPYESTFAYTNNSKCLYKKASGSKITHDSLTQLVTAKYDKIKEYFGKDLADALKKDAVPIFESLPNDAKEIISNIADGTL